MKQFEGVNASWSIDLFVFIRERQAVQVFHFLEGFIALDDAVDAAQDAGHFRPVAAGGQGFQEGRHHVFPFPLEDIVDVFVVFQDLDRKSTRLNSSHTS